MAGTKRREINDEDVRGLKYFRVLQPLLERLHRTGTERDTAGNRRLFMDQYCMLVLVGLFSPAIDSLRTLQRAGTLDKIRKRPGCSRASLGSLSESVAIFDPTRLKEIAAELGGQVSAKSAGRFAAVAQHLTAVDGTVIETVKRVAELSFGDSLAKARRPDHPVRLIRVAVRPHESYRGMKGPRCDGTLRIVTSRLDLPAELVAEMYRLRWTIEMFFRTFKQLLGCKHLFSTKHNGVEIQTYCAMIACMLILIYTGRRPDKATLQMVRFYLDGWASIEELEAFIVSRR